MAKASKKTTRAAVETTVEEQPTSVPAAPEPAPQPVIETEEDAPLAPKKPLQHGDGVYFGLSSDDYHNDTALGSHDIINLMKHPADYWWGSWMNPVHEPWETDATNWGTAFHSLICEGDEAFRARYHRGPAKADYGKNLLDTMNDMKRWLQLRGYAQTGNKPELIKRVLNADPKAPVWEEIVRREATLAEGRVMLKPEDFDSVAISSKMITKNPHCAKAFSGGYPEVSIFWTDEHGVRLKCRMDYLRFRAIIDLKSFRSWRNVSKQQAIRDAIRFYSYDIQAAHYCNMREKAPKLITEGKVFGNVSKAWLDRFVEAGNDFRYVWVFYQAEGAPIALRRDYLRDAPYHERAQFEIRLALESYRRHMEVFGTDIWVDVSEPEAMADEDMPMRMSA